MKSKLLYLADDHAVLRESLATSIKSAFSDLSIKSFSNGTEVLDALETETPDIIMLDINMPELNGIQTCSKLKDKFHSSKIVFLSMHDEWQYIKKAQECGADGYLLKTEGLNEIIFGLKQIDSTGSYFSKQVQEIIKQNAFRKEKEVNLTLREKEVLALILEEHSNKEIADKLFISPRTVDAHKRNLLAKTKSKNLASLIKFAIANNLDEMPTSQ